MRAIIKKLTRRAIAGEKCETLESFKTTKRFHRLFGAKEDSTVDINSEKTFYQKLKIERSRTHRSGHGFSLVVFDLEELRSSQKDVGRLIKTINSRIRDIDQIGWYEKKRIGVVLPYTSAKGAKEFSKKIINLIDDFQKESKYTLITYPPEKKSFGEKSAEPILRSM